MGFLIEGPFGEGYLWHHLACAARKHYGRVEEAYAGRAWEAAKSPVEKLPGLDELAKKRDEAAQRAVERKKIPYGELSPSGRAKCKCCGEPIAKGELRVVLGRLVEFGSQVRTTPVNVHTGCVADELDREDSAIEPHLLRGELRANSSGLSAEQLEILLESLESSD